MAEKERRNKALRIVPVDSSKVSTSENVIDLNKILDVGDDINDELNRQASLTAFVANHEAAVKAYLKKKENELEVREAQLRKKFWDTRRYSDRTGHTGKPTAPDVSAWIARQRSIISIKEDIRHAQFLVDRIKGVNKALDHKMNSLIGLGANYRVEMKEHLFNVIRKHGIKGSKLDIDITED